MWCVKRPFCLNQEPMLDVIGSRRSRPLETFGFNVLCIDRELNP